MAGQSAGQRNRLLKIEKRNRLEKLFERGEYVHFNADGSIAAADSGQWVERIYVASPNPFQRDQALREGQAARALVVLDARENAGTKEWLEVRSFIAALDQEELIEFVLNSKTVERLNEARRDVLVEDEWNDYNQLRDAMRQYEDEGYPVDDPKWDSLRQRDLDFAQQVSDQADELRATEKESLKMLPREALEKRAVDIRVESAGSVAFVREYENWMMLYAVRDADDTNELLYDELVDFKSSPRHLQNAVAETLANYIDESAEAKN